MVQAELCAALRAASHDVTTLEFGGGAAAMSARITEAGATCDVLIIAGGDGSVHYALPALENARAALYHVPMGTENLFAREFGMLAQPQRIAGAVTRNITRCIDLGRVTAGTAPPRDFAIMAGLGPDAGVIRRLAAARTGPITHASYIPHVAGEMFSPNLPTLTVEVDGSVLVKDTPGWLVVANMRQFGARIDPAPNADPADGVLDVVFMPCTDGFGAAGWVISSRLGTSARSTTRREARGRVIRVARTGAGGHRATGSQGHIGTGVWPMQLDGEDATPTTPTAPPTEPWESLEFRAVPGRLRILMP